MGQKSTNVQRNRARSGIERKTERANEDDTAKLTEEPRELRKDENLFLRMAMDEEEVEMKMLWGSNILVHCA